MSGNGLAPWITLLFLVVLNACAERDRIAGTPQEEELPQNLAPVIDSLAVGDTFLPLGDATDLEVFARDPEGSALRYEWQASAGVVEAAGARATWSAPATEGTFTVTVTVRDDDDATASRSVEIDALGGTLVVETRQGVMAVKMDGSTSLLHAQTGKVEVVGTRIFVVGGSEIQEIDHEGRDLKTIPLPDPNLRKTEVVMHPDLSFSFYDNVRDSSYVADSDGRLVARIGIPNPSPESAQSIRGVFFDSRILLAETGNGDVFEIDLQTNTASIFRTLGGTPILSLGRHADGSLYITRSQRIETFDATSGPETVAMLDGSNAVAVVPVLRSLFVTLNFTGAIYRVDRFTGARTLLAAGLDRPGDTAYLPGPSLVAEAR